MSFTTLTNLCMNFTAHAATTTYHVGFAKLYFTAYNKLSNIICTIPTSPRKDRDKEEWNTPFLEEYRDLRHNAGWFLSFLWPILHLRAMLWPLLSGSATELPSQHSIAAGILGTLVGLLCVKHLSMAAGTICARREGLVRVQMKTLSPRAAAAFETVRGLGAPEEADATRQQREAQRDYAELRQQWAGYLDDHESEDSDVSITSFGSSTTWSSDDSDISISSLGSSMNWSSDEGEEED